MDSWRTSGFKASVGTAGSSALDASTRLAGGAAQSAQSARTTDRDRVLRLIDLSLPRTTACSASTRQCTMPDMPNIASVLKAEISRVARKEVRAETEGLKKAASAQRTDIIGLRRRIQELEKQLKALSRSAPRGGALKASAGPAAESDGDASGLRFHANGMATNRKRLGLSAKDFEIFVGATGQSVYSWERGKSKPRATNLAATAELRGIGKQEAAARVDALKKRT